MLPKQEEKLFGNGRRLKIVVHGSSSRFARA
jgi:hypothetical protein